LGNNRTLPGNNTQLYYNAIIIYRSLKFKKELWAKQFHYGCTSGIGLVTACELAAHGNNVIATAEPGKRRTLLSGYQRVMEEKAELLKL